MTSPRQTGLIVEAEPSWGMLQVEMFHHMTVVLFVITTTIS